MSQTNESATVPKTFHFSELNKYSGTQDEPEINDRRGQVLFIQKNHPLAHTRGKNSVDSGSIPLQIYAPLTFPSKDEVASNNGAKPLTLSLNVTTYVEWTLQGPWNFLPITGTDIALVYFTKKNSRFLVTSNLTVHT